MVSQDQILDEDVFISYNFNTLGIGINPTVKLYLIVLVLHPACAEGLSKYTHTRCVKKSIETEAVFFQNTPFSFQHLFQ